MNGDHHSATAATTASRRSAWREPMVWLVAAIPASAVVASFALLTAAARSSGTDDAVGDVVQRTAQVQVADMGADARARALGLQAIVRVEGDRLTVLPAAGAFDHGTDLVLTLRHPTHAERDLTRRMRPTPQGWGAQASVDIRHDWNVQLAPPDASWRLQGRWGTGVQAAHLGPALRGD